MKRITVLLALVAALFALAGASVIWGNSAQAKVSPYSVVGDGGTGTNICNGPYNEPYNPGQYYAPGGVRSVWPGAANLWLYYNDHTAAGAYFSHPYSPYCAYNTVLAHAEWQVP